MTIYNALCIGETDVTMIPATTALADCAAERDRLRALNAELLAALKGALSVHDGKNRHGVSQWEIWIKAAREIVSKVEKS